jgi:hypothetical protein
MKPIVSVKPNPPQLVSALIMNGCKECTAHTKWSKTISAGHHIYTLASLSVDVLAWIFDPKGVFSVKSAYKVGIQSNARKKAETQLDPALKLRTALTNLGGAISRT